MAAISDNEQLSKEALAVIGGAGWPNVRRTSGGDIADGPEGAHFEIQCQDDLRTALAQVRGDAALGDLAVLLHRPARSSWMATVQLDDLLALLRLREIAGRAAGLRKPGRGAGYCASTNHQEID